MTPSQEDPLSLKAFCLADGIQVLLPDPQAITGPFWNGSSNDTKEKFFFKCQLLNQNAGDDGSSLY